MSPRTEVVYVEQHSTTFREIRGVVLEGCGFAPHEISSPLPSGIEKGLPNGGGDGCTVGRELLEGLLGQLVRTKVDDCHSVIVLRLVRHFHECFFALIA